MRQKQTKRRFTLIEIMIVVAIIGLLATIALPNYIQSRRETRLTICLENLRAYQGVLECYALDHGGFPDSLDDLVSQGYLRTLYECPLGGPYAWSGGGHKYHLLCDAQHTPATNHVCIHENQPPTAK